MSGSSFKTQPTLDKNDSFENWEKSVRIWELVTDVPAVKRGAALLMVLTGKDRDVAHELSIAEINCTEELVKILDKLGKIYKKDQVDTAFEIFESFIRYKRDSNVK